MGTISNIACKTVGAVGMSAILYDAYSVATKNAERVSQMASADHFEKVHLSTRTLSDESSVNGAMQKKIAEAKKYLGSLGISYVEATANTNDEVIAAANTLVSDKVDAVFTPTDNVIMAAEISVAEIFADAKIPHYTGADSFVRNGAFVTCGVNYTELGKQTADIAYEAMTKGMNDMDDYTVVDGGIITVNTETAEKLGISTDVFKDFGQIVEVTTTEE